MNSRVVMIAKGATDITLLVKLYDFATGALATGVTITDLDLYYLRVEDDNDVTISSKVDFTALANLTAVHADNKAYEAGQGYYRIDIPDAAFATGASMGSIVIKDGSATPAILDATIDFQLFGALGLSAGSTAKTYRVTEDGSYTGTAVADCTVWVTSDSAGEIIVASGTTDSSGDVTFYLNTGQTYYVWKKKDGYTFENQPETVTT